MQKDELVNKINPVIVNYLKLHLLKMMYGASFMDWLKLSQECMLLRSDGRLVRVSAGSGSHTINLGRLQG